MTMHTRIGAPMHRPPLAAFCPSRALLAVLLAFFGAVTDGIAAEPRSPQTVTTGASEARGGDAAAFRIGPSDVLTISVWNREELDRTVTVRPDGKLSFSLVGEVMAAGLTPLELQTRMEEALSRYINIIPGEVSVVVDAVHSYAVSVLGEVRLPGRFEFQRPVTVLDALAQAGGLTEFAASSRILIVRTHQGRTETIPFNYQRWVKAKDDAAWVPMVAGDIIIVP